MGSWAQEWWLNWTAGDDIWVLDKCPLARGSSLYCKRTEPSYGALVRDSARLCLELPGRARAPPGQQQQPGTAQPWLRICDCPPWQTTRRLCDTGLCLILRTGCESTPVLLCTDDQHKVPAPHWLHFDSKHGPACLTQDWSLALSWQMCFDLFYTAPWRFICVSNNTQHICFPLAHGPR